LSKIFTILLLVFIGPVMGEESAVVSGRVIDGATNKGITNVNLFIPSQNIGTATGSNGSFLLAFQPNDNVQLNISHIGYSSSTMILSGETRDIVIELNETFFQLEDVVVTSTRTEKLHKNVPVATEIISKKDILDSGALNVAELLSTRSGVSLQTSVDGGSMLNILGMDSRYILILLDGQPITGKFNNRVQLDQITMGDVEKVEIIKGPNSSLYGSEAMAGVINIITNVGASTSHLNGTARYSGTENKLTNDGITHGSSAFKLNWKQNWRYLSATLNADVEKLETDKEIQQIEIDDIHKQTLRGRLDWRMNNHSFSLDGNIYNHDEEGNSTLMNTETFIDRLGLILSHDWEMVNGWTLSHSFQNHSYSRNYIQARPWGDIETDDITEEGSQEYEGVVHKKFGTNELNMGVELSKSAYLSDRVENGKQALSTNSIFSQYDVQFLHAAHAVLGARLDKYNGDEPVISPRIGLMYLLDRWKFRATWGKGFRAPSFMERFIDWNHIQFGYQVLGNPDLKPELSTGYTAGVEYIHPTIYQVSLIVYLTQFENLIEDIALAPAILSYHNIEKAVYKGLEIQSRWKISSTMLASWGINFIDNRNGDGDFIPNTQPTSGYIRWSYQNPKKMWGISIQTKWVGEYTPEEYDPEMGTYIRTDSPLPQYFILNLNSHIRLLDQLHIALGVKNVGDHTNDRFGPFLGRAVYIELSTQLNGEK